MKVGKNILSVAVALGLVAFVSTTQAYHGAHHGYGHSYGKDSAHHQEMMDLHKEIVHMSGSQGMMGADGHNQFIMNAMKAYKNKMIAETFWNAVFNDHNTDVIETMVSDDYVQHSPSFADGKDAFLEGAKGFLEAEPNSSAVIDHIVADGDYVYIHNHIKMNAEDRGQAAVDIFKIIDGKIVEHWDVIQDVPEIAANTNTMFFHK